MIDASQFAQVAQVLVDDIPEALVDLLKEFAAGEFAECRKCASELSVHPGSDVYTVTGDIQVVHYCCDCANARVVLIENHLEHEWYECAECEQVHTEFSFNCWGYRCNVCGSECSR